MHPRVIQVLGLVDSNTKRKKRRINKHHVFLSSSFPYYILSHIYTPITLPLQSIPLCVNIHLSLQKKKKNSLLPLSVLQIKIQPNYIKTSLYKMENNVPIITKRVWNMIRVALFMLRKGISKGKLMMDLNMMVKRRSKLAGKAITNLMFHHHHGGSTSSHRNDTRLSTTREYEFSCSNTPKYKFSFHNKRHRNNHFFTCAHAPLTQDNDIVTVNTVKAVLDNMVNNNEVIVEASRELHGFEQTPKTRQLRITDSPSFPLHDLDTDTDAEVDKAAEAFIKRFYLQLK